MTDFSDLASEIDDAVEEHLCDDGWFRKAGESVWPTDPVRVILERPSELATLQSAMIVQMKPKIRVRVASVPSVAVKDQFLVSSHIWRVCAAPTRPDDGAWWLCEVEDQGAPP